MTHCSLPTQPPLFTSNLLGAMSCTWFFFLFLHLVLKVTTTQQNITLDEGSTITLHCEVTLTEADEVWTFWLFNGRLQKTRPLKEARGTKTLSNTVKEYNMSLELKHVILGQSGHTPVAPMILHLLYTEHMTKRTCRSWSPQVWINVNRLMVQITNGENMTISCIAVCPEASYVDTFWLFNGSRKQTNSKYEVNHSRFKRTEGTMKSRNISLTIYNAGLNDSGQYSCVLNTSHGLTLKNFSVRVVVDASGKFIYLLCLPSWEFHSPEPSDFSSILTTRAEIHTIKVDRGQNVRLVVSLWRFIVSTHRYLYKRVRGWTSGRSLPVLNFVKYLPSRALKLRLHLPPCYSNWFTRQRALLDQI